MNEGPAVEPRTLSAAYEHCRQLHARHGRTYYLATLLLPRWKRRHVHALYRFTRYADEIVDDLDWVCCVVPTRGVLTPLMSPDQIATASSSKANATRRSAGSSAASS